MSKLLLEVKPEIDSAGGFQNLPWSYVVVVVEVEVGVEVEVEVEVVAGVGTRNRFCWGCPESTLEFC